MSDQEKKDWFDTGFGGYEREKKRMADAAKPNRYRILPGQTRELIFVDDDCFAIYEHNPQMNGTWRNWTTCVQGIYDEVPCCDILGARTRYYVGYFTAIDATGWTDNKGNDHKFELVLFPAKVGTLGILKRKKETRGSIAGAVFKVSRDRDKDPSVGNDFEFLREAKMDRLWDLVTFRGKKLAELFANANSSSKENIERMRKMFAVTLDASGKLPIGVIPRFNYPEVLKPMQPSELKAMLRGSVVSGGGDGDVADGSHADAGAGTVGEVPF